MNEPVFLLNCWMIVRHFDLYFPFVCVSIQYANSYPALDNSILQRAAIILYDYLTVNLLQPLFRR